MSAEPCITGDVNSMHSLVLSRIEQLISIYCIGLKSYGIVFIVEIIWLLGFIKISLHYNTAE